MPVDLAVERTADDGRKTVSGKAAQEFFACLRALLGRKRKAFERLSRVCAHDRAFGDFDKIL